MSRSHSIDGGTVAELAIQVTAPTPHCSGIRNGARVIIAGGEGAFRFENVAKTLDAARVSTDGARLAEGIGGVTAAGRVGTHTHLAGYIGSPANDATAEVQAAGVRPAGHRANDVGKLSNIDRGCAARNSAASLRIAKLPDGIVAPTPYGTLDVHGAAM